MNMEKNVNSSQLEEAKVMLKHSTSYWDFLDKMELNKGKSSE